MKENLSISQINEKLQQLLELSPEIKGRVVDKRRQNALDAMDKYAKSKALAGHKGVEPIKSDAATGSILNIADELPAEMDLDAEILVALKNCDFENPGIQEELVDGSLAELVAPNLKELSVEELKQIMEHKRDFANMDNSLYPSGWPADLFGPYPAKLAEALVLTEDNESLTDLFNIFYAHRQISEKAAHVFMKDVIDDPTGANKQLIANSKDFDADYVTDMLDDIAAKYPQFVEDAKKKYNL